MIRLTNVRTHNLKNISLDIPYGQWLAICGLSGSGKSSLAFDTLFAEGQRRYLECLSPATRRMLTLLDKADADHIEGIPPAIAVEPKGGKPDRRSTVGNATDILEYLRILFARLGQVVCPVCQSTVARWNADAIVNWIEQQASQSRYFISFARQVDEDNPVENVLATARREGFLRAVLGDRMVNLDNPLNLDAIDNSPQISQVFLVVDRLSVGSADRSRVCESVELALQNGAGACQIWIDSGEKAGAESLDNSDGRRQENNILKLDHQTYQRFQFSNRLICGECSRLFATAEPQLFSFSRKDSACPDCDGIGYQDVNFRHRCPSCLGHRLTPEALVYQIGQRNIAEVACMTVQQLDDFFCNHKWLDSQQTIAKALSAPIQARLEYLQQVGLGYLNLDRPLLTLSEGEQQRVLLTTCLSSTLTNMLYILDEPSRGLHWVDLERLVAAIDKLHQRGNTVVVVDHRDDLLVAADRVVEIGPGAGTEGGEIVFDDSPQQLVVADTHTADFFSGRRGRTSAEQRRPTDRGSLELFGAAGNNLKNINVRFPLRCLCAVTGVSGAGKSSLVIQTLYQAIADKKSKIQSKTPTKTANDRDRGKNSDSSSKSGSPTEKFPPALPFEEIRGCDRIDEVLMVDTSPIGRSGRSNPLTYIKAFDEIRQVFAETADAKTRRVKPGHFSFNVKGGRCEKCHGDGELTVDMQFLPDMHIRCDECQGTRFKPTTLEIRYRGLNIAEVLQLTANEAFSFFRGQPKVQARLKALIDVGLGYLQIGQPANKLSGGEAQRLKLANYLNVSRNKRTLFIMEEPTTGLHGADVVRLLDCFSNLLAVGHSIIVVEHNPIVIANADWVIDLGPAAGEAGGRIVASGTPEQIQQNPDSATGRWLARWLTSESVSSVNP